MNLFFEEWNGQKGLMFKSNFEKIEKKIYKIEKLDWKFSPNHTEILFKVKFTLCYETEFKRNISKSRHDLCQDLLTEFP